MLEVETGGARLPLSLRARARAQFADIDAKRTASVAGLIAVASISGAEAQQTLPPATVDAPVARPKPAASKPSAAQLRARTALRRAARQQQPAQVAAVPFPNAGGLEPDASPYADPAAPYKADRVASGKFTEPLVNTPRTITVLTKEILQDQNATTLRDVARSTAGITLGTGEGGNAFGDRFFIRGFDARNDVFIDGIRDPAISIRENFFTEQIEILRGPASTFAGRGTAGGAINIVTKQAGDKNFQKMETQIGNANQKRVTFDVNQVISPTLSLRGGGLIQDSNVPGRNYVTDDRHGGFIAAKWTPLDTVKVDANFVHTYLKGLPDFGVPYNRMAGKPVTDTNVPRETWYGFVNRDFQKAQQDFGTISTGVKLADWVTFNNKSRLERSVLDYVGVLPNNPQPPANPTTVTLSSQSRYQVAKTAANVSDFTFKYDTGEVKHATIVGAEFSREAVSRDTYANLTAELNNALPGGPTVSIFDPPNLAPFAGSPRRAFNVTDITVDTKAGYLIETANWRDFIILNGGVRVDDYSVKGKNATAQSGVNSTMFNYNVGAVVKPLPYASLYSAYATSSNPVGAELDANGAAYGGLVVNNTTFQALAPERNKAVEVGTKWELIDRHLLVTAALFQTTKENARETSGANIIAGASYRVRGIDIEVTGNLTSQWSVYGGYVNMESEVLKSITPAEVGARLANIAHQSFNLMSKYKTGPWEFGGQAIFGSKIFGGTFGAINGNVLPSHWRFDAFTEYKLNKNWTAKLFVNNIFDTVYYDAFYRSATPFTFIAPGRSVIGVLAAKF